MWGICNFDDNAIKWGADKLQDGYQIRIGSEHKNVAKIGLLMNFIKQHTAIDNTMSAIDMTTHINSEKIPEKLVGTECEQFFREIFERLRNVSNP